MQGEFEVSREAVFDEHTGKRLGPSYKFEINVLDGLKVHRYEFARFHSDETNLDSFWSTSDFYTEIVDEDPQKGKLVAIWGNSLSNNQVLSLVWYHHGNFHRIPILDRKGDELDSFASPLIQVIKRDSDIDIAVIERYEISHHRQNTIETVRTYYDYDHQRDVYYFIKNTTEIKPNHLDETGAFRSIDDPVILEARKYSHPELVVEEI